MVSDRFLVRCFLILSIFSHTFLSAVVYGSETQVSLVPAVTFPAADNDNAMLCFGGFRNGFTLEDSTTTCAFQSIYPVSGMIALNGGSLSLHEDFIVTNTASITGGGQFIANNHQLQLCASVNSLNSTYTFHNVLLVLGSDMNTTGQLIFEGDCHVMGVGYRLTLSNAGSIVVAPGSRLVFDTIDLNDIHGANIACADDSAQIVLHDTQWHQSDDFTFGLGSIEISQVVDIIGPYSFIYDSHCTSTIDEWSRLNITQGMVFEIGRKDGQEPLHFESNETSILSFQDSSLLVTNSGMQLVAGQILVDGNVMIDSSSTSTDVGLIFGDGTFAGDISLTLNSGASVQFRSGWLVYNNAAPSTFFATSKSARAIRYASSKTYIKNNWLFPEMTLVVDAGQPTTVLEVGKTMAYDNVHLVFENVEFDFSGNQFGDALFALNGNGLLFLTKGTFQPYLGVSGTGNQLWGTGDIAGPVVFADSSAQLTCNLNGSILYDIALNSGTIILGNDFYLGPQNTVAQMGTVDLGGHRCVLGTEDQVWTSTLVWENGSISLNSHVTLLGAWTFQHDCVVYGGGNMLDLDGVGKIVVADGARVTFRDIRIRGISGNQIQCLGDSSTLVLDGVIWEQDGDFTFAQGKIKWSHDVKMKGASTFTYQSGQVSTILMESNLTLDPGFTFKYDPAATASQDLISFEDSSSTFVLNGATLQVAAVGMHLTRGVIQVLRDSFLLIELQGGAELDGGLTLGDSMSSEDVEVYIGAGVVLTLQRGSLNYKNVNPSSLFLSNVSSVLSIQSGAILNLYQSMNVRTGVLTFGNGATLARVAGKQIMGAVQPQGRLLYASLA